MALAMDCNSEGIWKEVLTIILRCYSYIVTLWKKDYDFGLLTECTLRKLGTKNISNALKVFKCAGEGWRSVGQLCEE